MDKKITNSVSIATPNPVKDMKTSACGDSLYVFCEKCNERQQVAFGKHVAEATRETVIKALQSLGWQAAPRVLCFNCKTQALPKWVTEEEKNNPVLERR